MSGASQAPPKPSFRAVVFDMDGVVTRTVDLHAAAWKELFDDYLGARAQRTGEALAPFDVQADYLTYVDGKPRREGARSFLAARGITLPDGGADEPPEAETIYALARRKDELFERRLRKSGAAVFDTTIALIDALRARGVATAVVTSSRHGREVLAAARVTDRFDVTLDGADAAELKLKGKPDPDIFLAAVERLRLAARECVVVEDAAAGVMAGRHGGFGLVIGVDRGGNRQALTRSGADRVVADLGEFDVDGLDEAFRRRASTAPPDAEDAWRVEQEGFEAAREHDMESLFTVGNGYLGVRGSLDMPLPGSQADLFVAGIYDRKQPGLPYSELEFLTERRGNYAYAELVSLPFPFRVRITVGGRALNLADGGWRELRRVLDLRCGVLNFAYLFEDGEGRRTSIATWRCASMADPHLLLQEIDVTCENHDALVEIDTSMHDPELAANHPHLQALVPESGDGVELRAYRTRASGYVVALLSRARLEGDDRDQVYVQAHGVAGTTLRVRRCVSVFSSRDGVAPPAAVMRHARRPSWAEFSDAREAHEHRWREIWESADIQVGGSPGTTQALRFNAYHLRIAASLDPHVSIGARTLSGRAYEGHIFWDVEVFMLPYFAFTFPDLARSLLGYRYHTLAGARARAAELGYRGACYAWESTVTGADATPRQITLKTSRKSIPIYTGTEQIHVTAAVAYGVVRYFEATGDGEFLREIGAEILLETARFWASRCVRVGSRYHIKGVTGPDEYHHTVDDNAYTNWMAHFNLERACWVLEWLARHAPQTSQGLREKLHVVADEPAQWQRVASELYRPGPNAAGVIEQFAGFFGLRDYVVPDAERFRPPLRRLFEAEKINAMQLIKQADVLMLPFLFPERFSREVIAANYRYYEPRTDHGSSLSPAVHAAVAARLGMADQARAYWRRGLWLDLSNAMGNSALGVHAASMAGAWQALVFGFLGVRCDPGGPVVDPAAAACVPQEWRSVEFRLRYGGKCYPVLWRAGKEAP